MLNFETIASFYQRSQKKLEGTEGLREKGIYQACFDKEIIQNTKNTFNLELKNTKIYDQKDSYLCWIYAYLSFLKPSVCSNLDIPEEEFDISVSYIHFFDRLEKSNCLYEKVAHQTVALEEILEDHFIAPYASTCGAFNNAKEVIKKYGIVPECEMPMNINTCSPFVFDSIFKEKLKGDILNIIALDTLQDKEKLIHQYVEENYLLLSKVFGTPPVSFDFKYLSNTNKEIQLTAVTPLHFVKICLKDKVDDFVFVMSDVHREFYQSYPYDAFSQIYLQESSFYNIPLAQIKEGIIQQLQQGIPVWFGCDFRAVCGSYTNKVGILDSNLFAYKEMLGIQILKKSEQEKFRQENYHHAMIITGVQIENGVPIRWKVQNSFGKENNQKGYFVMNNNYFEEYAVMFGLHKDCIQKKTE